MQIFGLWRRILQRLGFLIAPTPQEDAAPELLKREKPPEFESSKQVRVLLFRELNGQDRRLLFDSKSVRKRDPTGGGGGREKPTFYRRHHESSIEKSFKLNENHSNDFVYEWQKSSPDEQMLREMIFGSVSITYQGTTFKVHTIRSPPQIMLSVVFAAPPIPLFRMGESDRGEEIWTAANESDLQNEDSHLAHSIPVNVPRRFSGQYECDSHDGYSSLPTLQHLTAPQSSLPRSNSYNSLQRRLLRNKATSIELGLQNPDESSSPEDFSRSAGQKRVKLGLSIVINLKEDSKDEERQFSHFLFSHMSLIEGHLMSLKETVIRAYLHRRHFVQFMFEGAKRFQQAIQDLYTSPRLSNPEWLTLISSPNHRHLSYSFLSKFAHILKQYDKKETHFFVSTLLSAVLAHHLSWVPSVVPTDSNSSTHTASHKHTPGWVDLLAKSRPYNPHWVQLSDLYGTLGSSPKLCKTVVRGQNKDILAKFLQVLSYFIRCSDVCEHFYEMDGKRFRHSNVNSAIKSESKPSFSQPVRTCKCKLSPSSKTEDTDSASDSSKDACDISITPPGECMAELLSESSETLLASSGCDMQTQDNRLSGVALVSGCPCYDKPLKEEEEGYHSMEEPHMEEPGLSDMLRQYETWCPAGLEEVPLSELQHCKKAETIGGYRSYGWSLMAGISTHYLSDFCLQGVTGPLNEDLVREDLIRSSNINVVGEQVSEAVCIVADLDKWSVQLLSSNYIGSDTLGLRVVMSSLVSEMCDSILNMCELSIPPESCIIYLEDRLQELYFRSQMLSTYLQGALPGPPALSKVSSTLNVDASDFPLLLSIAATHSQQTW